MLLENGNLKLEHADVYRSIVGTRSPDKSSIENELRLSYYESEYKITGRK